MRAFAIDDIFFFDFFFFPFSNMFTTEPKSSTSDALDSNGDLFDLNLNSTSCSTFLYSPDILLCTPRHFSFQKGTFIFKIFPYSSKWTLRITTIIASTAWGFRTWWNGRRRWARTWGGLRRFSLGSSQRQVGLRFYMHLPLINKQAIDVWTLDFWTDYLYCHYTAENHWHACLCDFIVTYFRLNSFSPPLELNKFSMSWSVKERSNELNRKNNNVFLIWHWV